MSRLQKCLSTGIPSNYPRESGSTGFQPVLKIDCGCGLFFQRQVGWEPILEDALLLAVAGWLYWQEGKIKGRGEEESRTLVQSKS